MEGGYRLLRLQKLRPGGGNMIRIELAGPEAPGSAMVEALRKAAEEQAGEAVRLRIRTLLDTETPPESLR